MALAKKKIAKKTPNKKAPSVSLPQSEDIPKGMKQMGGGYAKTWTPEKIGDHVHGAISALPKELTLNKGKKTENVTEVLEVTTREGERLAVWKSAVLSSLFDEINEQGDDAIGTEIFIRYDGLGKKKTGQNPAKLFTVAVQE